MNNKPEKKQKTKKTISLDFDGVIHKYSKGYQDGSIYDEPIKDSFKAIKEFMDNGYAVYVLSTRNPWRVQKWFDKHLWMYDSFVTKTDNITVPEAYWNDKRYFYGFKSQVIWQPWIEIWDKPYILGITNRKLPALAYIDDRAIKFTNWNKLTTELIKNKIKQIVL